jgi:hypothetical protein
MIPLRRAIALVHSPLVRRALVVLPLMCIAVAACSSSAKSPTSTTAASTTTAAPTTSTGRGSTGPSTTIATTIKESAYVVAVDPAAHTVTLDPMEFLTGSPANAAYRHDNPGAGIDTPPNDYYIVNPTKDRVVMPLTPDAVVLLHRTTTGILPDGKQITPDALGQLADLKFRPFWITIERGEVSEVEEQYVP